MTAPTPPAADRKQQRKRYSKSSAIEYQKRVETVRRLILSGMDTDAIIQNVTDLWGVKWRMAYHYLAKAREKNKAYNDFKEAEMFAEHIAIRRDIRRRAQAAGDMKAELAAARDEAQLIGLYAPTKIAPTTPDGQHEWLISEIARERSITPDEARQLIDRLAAVVAPTIEDALTGKLPVEKAD